ncbi:hypothetical protein AYI70_g464 [Smittium culicis]|uniref:Uncharacterized protein n=1 Tax=Smittium culicis TaxID=133412 RepID=A0A1R1YGK9_9FUNG|nr:hypothetical protein AYI70_g464 [Smittium culicis]
MVNGYFLNPSIPNKIYLFLFLDSGIGPRKSINQQSKILETAGFPKIRNLVCSNSSFGTDDKILCSS